MRKVLRTIPQALDVAAEREGAGFTFVADDLTEETHTFASLARQARELAVALEAKGMRKGDRVALILPGAGEFILAFLGVLQGGGIPVPMYPPMGMGQLTGYLDHAKHITSASRATHVITTAQIKAVIGKVREAVPEMRAILTMKDLEGGDASLYRAPDVALDDTCFLQFTSGSTSAPKGVIVTHENLAHNCWAIMRQGLGTDEADRGVSWLPLFHDMGLIGFVLAPIHHSVPVSFMSPMTFLKRPVSWLQVCSRHEGTITYGPNFSYALATKRIRDRDMEGVDLSRLRVAGCGAEPIQADTLRAFAARFSQWGFEESAFVPSYGMAENTLAIAFSRGIPTDVVDPDTLWGDGLAQPLATPPEDEGADRVEIVGCGPTFADHEVRIVDVDTRQALPERRVGEIQVRGPSVTPGYFENAAATEKTIGPEGWLNTGDLGYLADGHVFICGREKDILIVNGKNYYPQDLEWAATEVEGVRAGNAVVFPSYKEGLGREAIVLVAETRLTEGHGELERRIKAAVMQATGLVVDEVMLSGPGTVPKTSSGKLQRRKARQLYEAGELKQRKAASQVEIAKHVVESQLAHLRLRIFGSGRK